MISNKILLICLAFIALTACSAGSKKQTNHHMENEKRTLVKLETTMGNITVALYNETPKHRDNFIKLVKEGVYDSTLFHRVIKQFMIQAGDPDSKNASDTAMLGSGDVGYTIPAESYTVFGEVTEGMEVVENIEIAKTNRADRPIENIRILKASIQ